ncbi:glycoside hydrolase family 13 protein [Christiangramia sp. SM2212]|uniref:Glycoside hydrolase family 13 protein n=1 Tax=Christiangramia sediminicola TaxID=3073267 RepID=A0ABU1EQN6_9FLAO|nr:glycoside hydrolase family 13 protein [Christiangramia sp. SM2212]MDR5590676.1 glycoside hydrolase family 13 protein [Christiangramia sp. SM2212]
MKSILYLLIGLFSISSFAQIERLEPPNWWIGFEDPELQLMVYGENIGNATPEIDYDGVSIEKFNSADSPNYLFIDLKISESAKPGKFKISFELENGTTEDYEYELKERSKPAENYVGFDNSDAIYLITPDRFANGDPSNDTDESLNEKILDRDDDYGRHGGDIRGIIDHLDYIDDMGFTALWSSPLLINDMKSGSYHGYAMTDFYRVDPRFGTLEEYKELADKAGERGIKIIMDQVANHAGIEHWWMKDLPFKDWINYQELYENGEKIKYSSHKRTTNQDLYAAESDKKRMSNGWFVDTMPDLNQRNPYMAKYLIQNSIWWIETLNLGGIRQDTYPYPDKAFMSDWAGAIMAEYPNFNIVGEEWSNNPLLIRYWQDGVDNGYDSNLRSTMDFAMQSNIVEGLNEDAGWEQGLDKLYAGLANDFAYASPEDIMIFPDNHDMSRIYTQLREDIPNTKMALSYILTLPRIVQIYYGTEILMDDTEKPGDHGLIRTEFPGGWEDSEVNAFTGEGLTEDQKDMQSFLKKILNYRKDSEAIQTGKTIHFAPENQVYLISRISDTEKVVLILNKNEEAVDLDLSRFEELGFSGMEFKNLITGKKMKWEDSISLPQRGAYFLTTKLN